MRHKIALLLTFCIAHAAFARTPSNKEVDAIVRPVMAAWQCKGMVVGLIDPAGRRVIGYGLTADGGKVPDGSSVFEIGSVTKTFTATLLAQMVQAGEVRLDQPVKELLPANVRMQEEEGAAITLLHLATHRSGLPRLPGNFVVTTIDNPYADYTPQMLYEALPFTIQNHKPGEQYEYSNFAVGLLGQALANKAGKDYEQLIIERITRPLDMNSTRIVLTDEMKSRLAPGHIGAAQVSNWDFDALAPAGAIRSTADDMLNYVAANLGLIDSPLAATMKLTHTVRAPVDSTTDIGLVWAIGKRTGARWHDGQTLGYHSFVAFVPDKKIGVVVLSNSGGGAPDTIGAQLIWAMLGNKVEPIPSTRTTSSPSPTP